MTDRTAALNEQLQSLSAPMTVKPSLSLNNIDAFLKEAYRINSCIATLNTYLRDVRQSYLSTTSPPTRRTGAASKGKQHMSDLKRDEIDAEAKLQLRAINKEIELMAKTEKARQEMAGALVGKKYGRSALVSWAAGGGGHSKSLEQEQAEAKAKALDMHHESILWYLRMKLGECGGLQASMMKKRIMRGLEKDRNNLAKSRAGPKFDMATFDQKAGSTGAYKTTGRAHLDMQKSTVEDELTPQQVQMFEKEGQDMLKHYQSTLDQVRTAEQSITEISELQTQLANNLNVQSAHIEQLVADSELTTENVGSGNKELKAATERKSTAKYIFYASCGLSAFLVAWDLII